MSSNDEPGTIPRLATFQLGEVPHGYVVLLLAYATSQEKALSRELESFVVDMSRAQARLLADALGRLAAEPPSGQTTEGQKVWEDRQRDPAVLPVHRLQ